jgi:hypothetical protein
MTAQILGDHQTSGGTPYQRLRTADLSSWYIYIHVGIIHKAAMFTRRRFRRLPLRPRQHRS